MVSALRRKLLRDLVGHAGQVITMAAVVACGVGGYVALRGSWISLDTSRDLYHLRFRFPDAFAHLTRAPATVAERLAAIPGVSIVETRLVEPVRVPLEDGGDPARGAVISLPEGGRPRLADIWLREGRLPEQPHEVVLLAGFAGPHALRPGDPFRAVMNGRQHALRVVGLADSPEYAFPVIPGELFTDPSRFAVLWMTEDAVAAAFGMEGAFDDVVLRLQPGAQGPAIEEAVDRVLEPYGGSGTLLRKDQFSAKILDQEMAQLKMLANTLPVAFLVVAAFLLQVALSRIVQLQRTQIATLKAFGYNRVEIGLHFLGFVTAVAVLGALGGLGIGQWFGEGMTALYASVFRLPAFEFRLDPGLVATSIGASVAAAVVGALGTVFRVAVLPPAEAMQPPAPPIYGRGWIDRLGIIRGMPPAARMMARDLVRRPGRLLISVLGIGFATGTVVIGRFADDAVPVLEDLLFHHVQTEDITVSFARPVPRRVLGTMGALPGVRAVEGHRTEAVRFSQGSVFRDGALIGYPEKPQMRRIVAWPLRIVPVPPSGVVLTDALAAILRLRPGDPVEVEILSGAHHSGQLRVERLVSEPVGLLGHVSLGTLAGLMREPVQVSEARLRVAPEAEAEVMRRLVEIPGVLGATRRSLVIEQFKAQTEETRGIFVAIASIFGAAMAIGVVYNNARVALSMRARELATLRVLGFGRAEVSAIVIGEQAVQVVLGIPLGLWMGQRFAAYIMATADPESWRFPAIVEPRTYAFAAVVVLLSTAACAWMVRRQVARLDLVGVLKTRE